MALGALVFALRPAGSLNQIAGALLVLLGASDLSFQMMRAGADAGSALLAARIAVWYLIPTLALTALLAWRVAPADAAGRRSQEANAVTIVGVAGAGALLVAFGLSPTLITTGVALIGEERYASSNGPLAYVLAAAAFILQALVVRHASRSAASPDQSTLQRRQAALVGLAFFLLAANAGLIRAMMGTAALARGSLFEPPWVNLTWALGGALALVVSLASLPRILAAFPRPSRSWMTALAAGDLLGGLFDGVYSSSTSLSIPRYINTRFLWIALAAALLALALIRYGLAGFGERTRRRLTLVARVSLLGAIATLPILVATRTLGDPLALAAAFGLVLAGLTFAPRPVGALASAFSRAITIEPSDEDAKAEVPRVYLAAAASKDRHDPSLVSLRRELGIDETELDALASLSGPIVLGRYHIERELGRGASGVVLLARDALTRERVVVKRFHATTTVRRGLAEARALAEVRDPRVIRLRAVEEVAGEIFLVLDYAPGGSVEDALARDGPFPTARALVVADDLLAGLWALHAASLVHGDVKPANVLLDADGRALLADLGAVRRAERTAFDATLTTAPVLGSYATMAPELLKGERPTRVSDTYSAAATIYRCLTGEDYVDLRGAGGLERVTEAILHEKPRLPHRRVPTRLAPVLERGLAKAPPERYPEAAALREALQRAAKDA